MRPCSTALAAYLAANDTFVIADLYTFALATGEVLRYSGWTTPLAIPGTAFPTGSLNYNALTYAEAVRVGLFDGATVELDRFFAPSGPNSASVLDTSLGAIVWFTGRVADTDVGRSKIQMKVK